MLRSITIALFSVIILAIAPANASGDYKHFEGKTPENLQQAFEYIREYNEKIASLTEAEMTEDTLTEIHELSYTVENALEKIREEMAALADQLEELHLASESYDLEKSREHAASYLSLAQELGLK